LNLSGPILLHHDSIIMNIILSSNTIIGNLFAKNNIIKHFTSQY
jgi:hypothetical protein